MVMFPPLRSVRAKMILVITAVVFILSLAIIWIGAQTYKKYRALQISECRSLIDLESQRINDDIRSLEANAKQLALAGELLYRGGKADAAFGSRAVIRNFHINTLAVGGGIWFAPYALEPDRELVCFYAYRAKNGVIFDESFEDYEYYYPVQSWYTSISRQLRHDGVTTAWTPPYVDETGTRALMTTVGSGIYDEQGALVGMSTVDWRLEDIARRVSAIRPTENSFVLFADVDDDFILALSDAHAPGQSVGSSLATLSWFRADLPAESSLRHAGRDYLCFANQLDSGMVLVINIPMDELFRDINNTLFYTLLALGLTALLIVVVTYRLLDRFINRPVAVLSRMAADIGAGNLDTSVLLDTRDELGRLAGAFNQMTVSLKEHIRSLSAVTAEKERIGTELGIAREIQASLLPSIYPPFPDREEFGVFATMLPAKEVGGDFYDFFLIDKDHLAVVIGDVSDKGVPAALFMVIAKTLIKNNAQTAADTGEVFTRTNTQLCENNAIGMFVTAFMGILNIRTGVLEYVNAGHNPPFVSRKGGGFVKLDAKPGLVLAGLEHTRYSPASLALSPGDCLFLYTDGVTETANAIDRFFGEGRLRNTLDRHRPKKQAGLVDLLGGVKRELDAFAEDAPQNDDIAMLGLFYAGLADNTPGTAAAPGEENGGASRMPFAGIKTLVLPAAIESLLQVTETLEGLLETAGCSARMGMQFTLAVEEVFVNIAKYAYEEADASGNVTARFEVLNDPLRITARFEDSGVPFNPLGMKDPDTTLPAEEREIGGLGIYLAKNNVDAMNYAYTDGKNIVTLLKHLEPK